MDAATVLTDALNKARDRSLNAMGLLSAAGQLIAMGHDNAVAELYKNWLEFNTDDPLRFAMYFNYGALLSKSGDAKGAKDALEAAIQINPNFIPPYINLGHVLEQLGATGEGVKLWYRVTELLPQVNGEGINYKTAALKQIGRVLEQHQIDENAEEALRICLEINPTQSDVAQHYVSLRQRQCKWPVIAPKGTLTRDHLLKGISALSLGAHTDDPLLQLANAAAYCKANVSRPAKTYDTHHAQLLARPPTKRRKVGYLSSDLREHAIGFLTAELYELHDRNNIEVFLYYCGHKVKDPTHQRIKAAADHWIDLAGMSDEQAAEKMVADGIEILVDVNGYTHSARLKLLGLRPAPIIVNWLGFPGSLGSPSHHYIIADDFIIPRESEIYYAEKVLRLPCYQPNDRKRVISERRPTRQEVGLPEDAMVFCCFNGAHKITPFTWARWMSILKQVPGSVLWLLESIAATGVRLKQQAEAAGVDPARIIFAPKAKNPDHLARYPLADLFLDTTPYGAHTTSSDALWMGVPVLTLTGRSFPARVCGSLLKSAGLSELICSTPERYIAMAVDLGRHKEKLAMLRHKLLAQRNSCVLFDTPLLASSLEGLYAEMWEDFKAGRLPRPDLSNLDIYNDIGCEIDCNDVELLTVPNYQELYLTKLTELDRFNYIRPDQRLWSGKPFQKTPPAPVETAETLLQAATAEISRGNLPGIEILLQRAMVLDPKNAAVLDLAARAAMMQGKLDLASGLAHEALQLRPVIQIGLTVAEVMKASGNIVGAAKFFNSVIATNPNEYRALVGLAEIYEQTENRASAIKCYESALALEPTNIVLAYKYAILQPIPELPRGLAAMLKAKPKPDAPLKIRLAYLNQLAPYKEWAERSSRALMPYHGTAMADLSFDFAGSERDEYEVAADALLKQDPNYANAVGAKAVCLLSRGRRQDSEPYFAALAKAQPDSIYENIIFSNDFYRRLEAKTERALSINLPPLIDVVTQKFEKSSIIYLSCNYEYYIDFARPMLMSINDVAPKAQVHLHIMDVSETDLESVKVFCANLTAITIAVSAERPGMAAKGLMPARCYYHAIRFIRLYQHMLRYHQPLWLMDVDALLHRDPKPLFASATKADAAFRVRPGRWEPWNQFNASVVGICPTPGGISYLRLIAAYIAEFHAKDGLQWGIDQLAMYGVHEYLKDQGRAPQVQLLNDRAVDYDYFEDGYVWCNSGKAKFSQLQQLAQSLAAPPDLQKVSYFEALQTYTSQIR